MAGVKPKNHEYYADEVEMTEAKLQPFHVDVDLYTSGSSIQLPEIYRLIDITRKGKKVTPTNKSEISYTENHPLTKASLSRSVFVREDPNTITIYPSSSESTYDIDTNASGYFDKETFEVSYYETPTTPNWAYVVVKNKALYNANLSTNFSLHTSEEEKLVTRILQIAGIIIMKPGIVELAGQDAANVKAQNND